MALHGLYSKNKTKGSCNKHSPLWAKGMPPCPSYFLGRDWRNQVAWWGKINNIHVQRAHKPGPDEQFEDSGEGLLLLLPLLPLRVATEAVSAVRKQSLLKRTWHRVLPHSIAGRWQHKQNLTWPFKIFTVTSVTLLTEWWMSSWLCLQCPSRNISIKWVFVVVIVVLLYLLVQWQWPYPNGREQLSRDVLLS